MLFESDVFGVGISHILQGIKKLVKNMDVNSEFASYVLRVFGQDLKNPGFPSKRRCVERLFDDALLGIQDGSTADNPGDEGGDNVEVKLIAIAAVFIFAHGGKSKVVRP